MSMPDQLRRLMLTGLVAASFLAPAYADTTLRLSTLFKPGSQGAMAADHFSAEVEKRTSGRVKVNVYPASQLGDWVEAHSQVMQGAIDIVLQPLSTSFDKGLAVAWFPYMTPTYESAEKAYSKGGFVDKIVDNLIAKQNLKLLGVYGAGMGGAGFASEVKDPGNVNMDRGVKIRVWPGGTTHRVLMERFGYNVATVPWAELYTAMQTGVVDGQIGGTAEMAMENFKDITETWIQYNDHFELAWFVMNLDRYNSLSPQDSQTILEVAQEITRKRFEEVRKADEHHLQVMRDAGVNVVTFDNATLEALADTARKDVWPKIKDEVGDEVMDQLVNAVN